MNLGFILSQTEALNPTDAVMDVQTLKYYLTTTKLVQMKIPIWKGDATIKYVKSFFVIYAISILFLDNYLYLK